VILVVPMWWTPSLTTDVGGYGSCFRRDDTESVTRPYAPTASGNTAAILVFSVAALKGFTM
jgi:hypothetical protein